jgi:hypothetical protein
MIENILKVSYPSLKKVKSGNFKNVKEELDLLGIDYSENDLLAAFEIAHETNSIEEAIKVSSTTSDDLVQKAKKKIKGEEKLKNKQAKQKLADEQIKKQAEAANYLKNIIGYSICGAKSMYELEDQVRKKIQEGYVPYGGVSTYNPGGQLTGVPDSFFQAMVMFK